MSGGSKLLLCIITMCREVCASYPVQNCCPLPWVCASYLMQSWCSLPWDFYFFVSSEDHGNSSVFFSVAYQEGKNKWGQGLRYSAGPSLLSVPDIFSLFYIPTVPAVISLDRKGFPSHFQGTRHFHVMKPDSDLGNHSV